MDGRAERILAAAARLFVRYGAAKTTIEDIAREAGTSKRSVYLEFSGKDELFQAVVKQEFRTYIAAITARVEEDPEGGRLSRIYYHSLQELAARPMLRALYTRDAEILGAIVRRGGAARYAPRLLLGREFVARMQQAGLIRADLDPDVLSHAMGVLSVGFLMAEPILSDGSQPPLPATVAMLADMLTGLAEPPPGQADIAAGKAAFTALCRQLDDAIAH